jgi:hypothetical protein
MSPAQLTQLRGAVNEILRLVPRDAYEAVNWGDLTCYAAESWIDDTGADGVRVFVAEASPEAHGLQTHIHDQLVLAGYPGIDVETQW